MYRQQAGKALFPFIILILVIIIGYLYLPASQGQGNRLSSATTAVTAETATLKSQAVMLSAVGSARANNAIYVYSSQSDYVTDIYFSDGDTIKQGAKLVQLQNKQEQLALKSLQINLKEQKRQLKRLVELAKTQSTAQSQLETQRSVVEALAAQLELEKTKLNERLVTAPFTGVLGKRLVSVGSYINSNTAITTLDDISVIKVDFQVPEKHLADLKVGMTVSARSDAYPNKSFSGAITHIDPRINSDTRSVEIAASFTNNDSLLRPGMLLHVDIELQNIEAVMLPEKSIIPRQDKHFVFIVDEKSQAQQIQVDILARFNGWVAISSGVKEGQQVITEGVIKIRPGIKVLVKG